MLLDKFKTDFSTNAERQLQVKINQIIDTLYEFNNRLENLEQIVFDFTGHHKP